MMKLGARQIRFLELTVKHGTTDFVFAGGAADQNVRESLEKKGLLKIIRQTPGYYPVYELTDVGNKYCKESGGWGLITDGKSIRSKSR
ncbi:hypothetical protein ACM4N5_003795 [Escherichia coli]|uniref:hypothetical protein n=1 Tax=Enterobacteriaceae TaxID=543 RepID=UPI001CD40A14|nr:MULTISPECIES: hypothetical protein [Enterobacteriaceae]MCU8621214.1 hypothetical protein [Klebsiella pneumoniae]MCW9654936.1 hypothetical protein [Klebsiella oxytoca]MDH8387109.1 hypothetical protein [Klebsiella pneumoniae]MDM4546304.1 hypothetical protein [Klebsiella oxytoca]